MTVDEMNQIVENLKLHSKEKIIDDAFQLLIDNQVVLSEFEFILNKLNYELPQEFHDLSKADQKRYHQHYRRQIEFTDKGPLTIERQIYNKPYFYELVEASKKNKKITESLMKYVHDMDIMPLYIIAMKYIKLKNITFATTHSKWMEYAEKKDLKSLYDFYMNVMNLDPSQYDIKTIALKKEFTDQLIVLFKSDKYFNLDMSLPFVKFAFEMEVILSTLTPKVANTIKVKFLVYKPDYLKENEYNTTLENGRTLINKHKDKLNKAQIKKVVNYYSKHRDILDSFNDNGYRAIYYSLVEVLS